MVDLVYYSGRYIREPQHSDGLVSGPSEDQTSHRKSGDDPGMTDNNPRSGELGPPPSHVGFDYPQDELNLGPIDESPQTQINHVFPMMWPNATALEAAEEVMGDDAWLEFLRGV